MSNNSFATGSWIGGAYVPFQQTTVANNATASSDTSITDIMASMIGSMMSNSQTPSVTMPSQMDVNTLANAITSNSGTASLNLPFGQQSKGISCNSYNKINRSGYGNLWS